MGAQVLLVLVTPHGSAASLQAHCSCPTLAATRKHAEPQRKGGIGQRKQTQKHNTTHFLVASSPVASVKIGANFRSALLPSAERKPASCTPPTSLPRIIVAHMMLRMTPSRGATAAAYACWANPRDRATTPLAVAAFTNTTGGLSTQLWLVPGEDTRQANSCAVVRTCAHRRELLPSKHTTPHLTTLATRGPPCLWGVAGQQKPGGSSDAL